MPTKAAKKRRASKKQKGTRASKPSAPAVGVCPISGLSYGSHARNQWDAALSEALAQGDSAALALIDVDGFSRHVEALGNERADALLAGVASRLKESLGDGLGRLAGDRFGLVLRGLEVEEALGLLERARAGVDLSPLRIGRGVRKRQVAVTVSVGIAGLRRDGGDLRTLMVAAQGALWRAKSLGGNRCGLSGRERMALKTSYYPGHQLAELKQLAKGLGVKESVLLREALDDLFLRYKDRRREHAGGGNDAE